LLGLAPLIVYGLNGRLKEVWKSRPKKIGGVKEVFQRRKEKKQVQSSILPSTMVFELGFI